MANKLPQVGVEVVALGSDRFFSVLEKIEASTQKTAKALEKTAAQTAKVSNAAASTTKSINPLLKGFDAMASKLGGFGQQINGVVQNLSGAQAGVSAFFAELPAGAAALTVAAAGMAAFATAFVALGTRGAGLVGIAESFDRLTQAVGIDAVASLERLRMAAGGTVSDMELLRLTNLALAGSVGKFGQEFGANLPKILEIARVQARATGQSVDFLFQSLITGIKRGSPLLIDNTGLVLKISEANEAMAQSLGKSVEALTAEEKQLAVLNATLAAGQTAIDAFAGIQETAADKIARMNATITNTLDALAIGVQPAFGMFLDVINRTLAMVSGLVIAINPLISSFLEMGAALITGPLHAILSILDPIAKLVSWLITLATVILQPVMRAITAFGNAIGTGVTRVVQFVGELINNNLGINFDNLALNLGRGAGRVFGAFAEGIMQAANNVILPAVLWIATAIADFLVGESPPPKGPLSQIDKGGANTMMAWLDGFAGVSLQPVDEVAAAVNATLGTIGAMTMPQVEARIATLDAALQPFNDQLAIVKANFEAISAPAEAALSAIDRQMGKALEALSAGEAGSAEMVRALDTQREKIQDALDSQQNLVDSASIQLALAQSQQSEERALLTIQQSRLKALEGMAGANDAVAKATKDAADASKGAGGAAAAIEPAVTGGGMGAFDMSLPSVSDLISGQTAVDQMGADLGQGFTEGLAVSMNAGTVSTFNGLVSQIGAQTTRIGQANIGQRIADAFTGIGTSIQGTLDSAKLVIDDWVGGITDPAREGSIPYSFNALMAGDWTALGSSLAAPFETFYTNAVENISNLVAFLIDPANENGILAAMTGLPELLLVPFADLLTVFTDNFDLISEGITEWIDGRFNPDTVGSIPFEMGLLPTRIGNALREVGDTFDEYVLTPITDTVTVIGTNLFNFFAGTGEGSLSGIIDSGVAWFTALPQRIFDALASLGQVFFAVFVTPMVAGINLAIEAIESFINSALSALGTLIGSLQGVADAVGLGDQIAEISASLVGGINLPRVSMPSAPTPQPLGARVGGMFSEGFLRVHKGEQLVNNATKTAVFPAAFMRDMDIIARVLGGGGSMPLPLLANGAGGSTSNTTFNQNFNMAAPPSSGNLAQQAAVLMAMKRR